MHLPLGCLQGGRAPSISIITDSTTSLGKGLNPNVWERDLTGNLKSEVHERDSAGDLNPGVEELEVGLNSRGLGVWGLQGYLDHKKHPPAGFRKCSRPNSVPPRPAVERLWRLKDSQGQIMALAFRSKS